jgi:hypothetical protein
VTKISFSIPSNEYVKLQVFDDNGRLVSELVNENLEPGKYETTFNASGLSSGIYFYRMIIGNFIKTKKMTLLK